MVAGIAYEINNTVSFIHGNIIHLQLPDRSGRS